MKMYQFVNFCYKKYFKPLHYDGSVQKPLNFSNSLSKNGKIQKNFKVLSEITG